MSRTVLGGLIALLFVSAGLFWWQGSAQVEDAAPPPPEPVEIEPEPKPDELPVADVSGMRGPAPPEATELTREQRRFGRYDRDRDGRITRNEMLSTRTKAFRKLDKDGNNLLTFEEWAVSTADKFRKADANADLELSPREFLTTRPKRSSRPACNC